MRATTMTMAVAAAVLCGGCTWVSLSEGGAVVQLVGESEAGACEQIGRTTARTTSRVGPYRRSKEAVFKDQSRLARNEAARMGGNAVTRAGDPEGDEQEFLILRCPES